MILICKLNFWYIKVYVFDKYVMFMICILSWYRPYIITSWKNMFLIHNLNVYIHPYHQIWTLYFFLPASSPCLIIKSGKLASKSQYYLLHFEMDSCKSSCNSNVMKGTKGCRKNLITVFSQDFWGTRIARLTEHSWIQHLSTNWREKTCVNTQIRGSRWTSPS